MSPLNTLAFLCQLLFVWNTFAMAQKGKWERHAVYCIGVRGDRQLLVWEDDELYTGTALTMQKGGVVKAELQHVQILLHRSTGSISEDWHYHRPRLHSEKNEAQDLYSKNGITTNPLESDNCR